jgi:4-amino-4-deoxy-L-arabinose transferase-like glycosyltransferase
MTQHPPGYYAVAAAVYDVVGAGEWRYDRAVFLLRALTALMIAATVPVCCYVAARQLTGRDTVGRIAAFVPLLIPQLHFIGGSVSNDGASIATASVTWAVLLTVTCSGPTRRRLLFLAVAVAAACWTKGTALTLIPCVPIGIALAYRRFLGGGPRRWCGPALLAAVGTLSLAFALGGWWWALNLVRYGRVQPAGAPTTAQEGDALDRLQYLQVFVERMRWTFFGEVGVREPEPLAALTLALALLFLIFSVAGLVSRARVGDRVLMLLAFGLTVVVLFLTTYAAHVTTKGFPGIQGRYLFVLLVPIAVLFASGVVSVADRGRLPERVLLPGVALVGIAVPVLAVGLAFQIFYVVPGRSWGDAVDLFVSWAAWSPKVIAALAGAVAAWGLALAWLVGRESRHGEIPEVTPEPRTDAPAIDDGSAPPVRTADRETVTAG